MKAKVDEWKRRRLNAERRASERKRNAEVDWPVLLVRLRLAGCPQESLKQFVGITSVKKKWGRRKQLQSWVEYYEAQQIHQPAERS